MDQLHYIYKITNKINHKVYIGQTVNPQKRWAGHKVQAKKDEPNQLISTAIKKYGSGNFEFEIIATCINYENANQTEEELIKQYDSLASSGKGYNLSLGGETAPKSGKWKAQMSAIKGGWIDRKHTEENIEKNRQAHLGTVVSEETKVKMSEIMKEKVANGWMPKTTFQPGSNATKYWKDKHNTNGFKPGRVLDPEVENKRLSALRTKGAWNKTVLSQEQVNEITKLSSEGNSVRKISKLTGFNRPLISKILQEKIKEIDGK